MRAWAALLPLLAVALLHSPTWAQGSKMKFSQSDVGSDVEYFVDAKGEITEQTPDDFSRFLERTPGITDWGITVIIDSPGGNLDSALRLGRLFRQHGIAVWIMDGRCLSACAYAFLGGHERRISSDESDTQSMLGFHRFAGPLEPTGVDTPEKSRALASMATSQSQVTSSELAAYIAEMGVDARLLKVASAVGDDGMAFPNISDLEDMRVIYRLAETWRFELTVENGEPVAVAWSNFSSPEQLSFICVADGGAKRPYVFFSSAKIDVPQSRMPASVANLDGYRKLLGSNYTEKSGNYFISQGDGPIGPPRIFVSDLENVTKLYESHDLSKIVLYSNDEWTHLRMEPSIGFLKQLIETPGILGLQIDYIGNEIVSYALVDMPFGEKQASMVRIALQACL